MPSLTFNNYINLLDELYKLVDITEKKVVNDEDDELVKNNVNFFTKSFTITLCAYLESFIKDRSMDYINFYNNKLATINIAHNIIKWSISRKKELTEINDNELKFENLKINIKKNELDDFISGSPYRTEKLFKKFGIELHKNSNYQIFRENVISIVEKRNKIIHHNDNASDLSFTDIKTNINTLKSYIEVLDLEIENNCC